MLYLIGLLLPICTVSHLLDFLDFLDLQNDASDDMYLINAIVFFFLFFLFGTFRGARCFLDTGRLKSRDTNIGWGLEMIESQK